MLFITAKQNAILHKGSCTYGNSTKRHIKNVKLSGISNHLLTIYSSKKSSLIDHGNVILYKAVKSFTVELFE